MNRIYNSLLGKASDVLLRQFIGEGPVQIGDFADTLNDGLLDVFDVQPKSDIDRHRFVGQVASPQQINYRFLPGSSIICANELAVYSERTFLTFE